MNQSPRFASARGLISRLCDARALCAILWLMIVAGCATTPSGSAPSARLVQTRNVELPARLISNLFLIEAKQPDGRVRRFIIDTGSSANLISPEFAARNGRRDRTATPRAVQVRSATGVEVSLDSVVLRRLQLDGTLFADVPALIYDFSELSTHLGLPIDGLLGFALFRELLLTLDYPRAQLRLVHRPIGTGRPADGANTITFNNERRTPLIPVQMGHESFMALLDSGSDGALILNPTGLHPRFRYGPRPGTVISSMAGDSHQMAGRLGQDIFLGGHTVKNPIVDLTDQLSSIGGEILRNFSLTFDQRSNTVVFARTTEGDILLEPRRSTGLAIARSPIYWRVMAVIDDTPTAKTAIQPGDLIVRINGEPVAKWNFERYATLLASAAKVTYTFLSGSREFDLEIVVFELVP